MGIGNCGGRVRGLGMFYCCLDYSKREREGDEPEATGTEKASSEGRRRDFGF